MKRLSNLSLLLLLIASSSAIAEPKAVWEISEGIDRPESAYYDADSGALFVSQVVGNGSEKDGKGWISKISADGKMIKEKWATGLNAPKGLRAVNGVLWVSDIDHFVGFNIADGKKVDDVTVPNAKFLNDVATGLDGTVYVSDMGDKKIYAYKDGKLSVFAEGEVTEKPNGLLVSGTRLLVGGWDAGEKAGHLFALDLRTKEKTLITKEVTGNLDGIELDGRGNYIVTDWVAGKVLRISDNGKVETILQLAKGSADHAFIQGRNLLIVPRMMENKITAYQVGEPESGFKSLLNGKDLSGWITTGNWKAEKDGVYSLKPRPGEKGWKRYGAYLSTEKKYSDFELHVEYKIPPRGNSGIYVRIDDLKDPVGKGIEVQVLDSYSATKKLGHHDHGGIIRTTGPTKNMSNPAGQWNKMIVICRKHHMVVILNGEKIQDLQLNETPVKDRPLTGYINIQDHGLPMEVRNIRIKELG